MLTREQLQRRVLSEVTRDVRRANSPELDWDRLEAKIFAALDPPQKSLPFRSRKRPWALALVPAIAAALGVFVVMSARHLEPPTAPVSVAVTAQPVEGERSSSRAAIDGDRLAATQVLSAQKTPVRLSHSGRAEWTLEADARASVLEHDGFIRVRLLSGALRASVVPSHEPESFVVEAADTRVAVHGTRFRVELRGDRTVVDVEEGVVTVGPRARPDKPSAWLKAPSHQEFSLQGSKLAPPPTSSANGERIEASRTPKPVVVAPLSSEEPAVITEVEQPPAPPPHALTIGEVETGVSTVVAAVSHCFKDNTEGSGSLRVSARTAVTLDVNTSGTVTGVSFAPPLSPAVQECSSREVLKVAFAASTDGAKITRVLELSH